MSKFYVAGIDVGKTNLGLSTANVSSLDFDSVFFLKCARINLVMITSLYHIKLLNDSKNKDKDKDKDECKITTDDDKKDEKNDKDNKDKGDKEKNDENDNKEDNTICRLYHSKMLSDRLDH